MTLSIKMPFSKDRIQLPKEILVVDEQLRSDIRDNPYYEDLARDFELVDIENIKNQKTFQVKSGNRPPMPLSEYNKKGHLVQSELYLDRYYPLFEYSNSAYEELAALMNLLCNFMGDNVKFECEIYEESLDISQSNTSINIVGGGNYKALEVNAECKSKDSQHISNENGRWIKFDTKVGNTKKTPKELKSYIEQNHINLHTLPASFRALVETYLQSPNAKIESYERQEYTLAQANKCIQKCKDFRANASFLPIFKAKFGVDFSGEESGFFKVKTQIRHSVRFE